MTKKQAIPAGGQSGEVPSESWLKSLKAETVRFVMKGDYASALTVARDGLKSYPSHPDTRFLYAKLLGDFADELPPAKKAKLKAESLEILRGLVHALAGRAPEDRFPISLNYYYQAEDFAGMYRFGKRFAQAHGRQGSYAQGIGAAYLAFSHRTSGRISRAKSWGARSTAAWRAYDLRKEKYYFPHYVAAMALVCEGEPVEARTALTRAAKLSGRKISDAEFADVLAAIEGASE